MMAKAQMASAEALGRIGADAIDPLCAKYHTFRDPDTRTIGRFAESIPAGKIPVETLDGYFTTLRKNLGDTNKGVKAKAVRREASEALVYFEC